MYRMIATLAVTLPTAIAASAAERAPNGAEFLNPPPELRSQAPVSDAVRAGDLMFLTGRVGADPASGKLAPGGIDGEARQSLLNIKNSLERYGASLRDVVKCTVFMVDMNEWDRFNEVYREFFKEPYPARSAVGVSSLGRNARVEVECVAYVPRRR